MKPTLSVCSIVKNESSNIIKMLESIIDFVDEIIITDTGSTDNTIELIKKYNVKVFQYNWDNNFSNARNFCISNATKDWILSLDADEELMVNNKDFKDNLKLKDHVYMINIKNVINNGDEIINCHSTKLFPNFQDFKFFGAVHEYIDREKTYNKSIIEDIELKHNGYNLNNRYKKERNISILIKELEKYSKNDNYYKHLLYLIGKEYLILHEYDKGLHYYKQFIDLEPDFNQANLINALTDMTKVFYILRNWGDLNNYADKYHNLLINSPDFCIFYGMHLSEIFKNYQKAIFYYQKALFSNIIQGVNYTLSSKTYKPNFLIGISYIYLNKPQLAVNYFKKALLFKKDYNTLYNLFLAYSMFDKNKGREDLESFNDILTDNEKYYLKDLIK
ncbi:MAG: glycosyltransferase [Candidatus Sericytochromatia bacterium]